MERFEFDSKTGPNSNRREGSTRRGAIEVGRCFPQGPNGLLTEGEFLGLSIRGPAGAWRGSAVLDKATAGKLGAALLKWAGADTGLLADSFLREMGYVVRNLETEGTQAKYCPACNGPHK